jgi:hypothetical protein
VNADYEYVYPSPDQGGVWSLSGRNGEVLWHRPAAYAQVVEDVDGDKRNDVVLVDAVGGDKRSGSKLTAVSGLDARRVYSRFFGVPRDEGETVEASLWGAGDLQPDRVSDLILNQSVHKETSGGAEIHWVRETLLSGASGRRLPKLDGSGPVYASVDGRGDDLHRWRDSSPSGITVVDGRTRRTLLDVALDIPLTLPLDVDYLRPLAASLDRDRCADLVGTLENSRSTFAVAIDGGSGRLLWARRLEGIDLGGPVTQTTRVDRNRAC